MTVAFCRDIRDQTIHFLSNTCFLFLEHLAIECSGTYLYSMLLGSDVCSLEKALCIVMILFLDDSFYPYLGLATLFALFRRLAYLFRCFFAFEMKIH